MCTIALFHRVHAELPLVVAATRDERYARPWSPPLWLTDDILGGRDDEQGGTWMAVTRRGLFAGITNQPTATFVPAARSRGEIVMNVLAAGTMAAARAHLASLDPRSYNPWNLAFGDGVSLSVAYGRPDADRVTIVDLGPGLHILANDVLEGLHPRISRARELFTPLVPLPWPALADECAKALGDPTICLHSQTYGTCSATILAVSADHAIAHYRFAPGPPCTTAFADVDLGRTG
jgi:uncharacterized protein with NRDE domain